MFQTKGDVSLKAEVILRCPCVLSDEGGGDHCNINLKTQKEVTMICGKLLSDNLSL